MNDDHGKPFSHSADPHGAKAHFDTSERKIRSTGVPGFWRQTTNLLILAGVIALIIVISRIF
ncbi:hypothetical protein [uncultured Paenibacillus sp.]|uniref:hypothetical protein n=1 Tax=uncultured Paenibacillus sp. TaxID=227322 RepID=UPI0015AB732B|nr:hypothetical protein [uncultured Paenibacillus sp.]